MDVINLRVDLHAIFEAYCSALDGQAMLSSVSVHARVICCRPCQQHCRHYTTMVTKVVLGANDKLER